MRLETQKQSVATSGGRRPSGFSIADSAKAFQIMSSGIYTNKIGAVLRELGTNAADSHVAVGKADVPFVVHLPNTIEPWFSVQDFGTGLNDAEIRGQWRCMTAECGHTEPYDYNGERCVKCNDRLEFLGGIYTRYFESNKEDSNEYTGCLGLGSKSPFAYTDQFQITSVKDGLKNIYGAYIDVAGRPTIDLLHSEKTEDIAGVTIQLSVKRDDFELFKNNAYLIYRWFGHQYSNYLTKPTIVGETLDLNQTGLNNHFAGNGYTFKPIEFRSRHNDYGSTIVVGNVAYPIELDVNRNDEDYLVYQSLIQKNVVIFLPLADEEGRPFVHPAASREKLQNTKRTQNTIISKLKIIKADLLKDVQAKIDACTSLWKAQCFFAELQGGENHYLFQGLNNKQLAYKGTILGDLSFKSPMKIELFSEYTKYRTRARIGSPEVTYRANEIIGEHIPIRSTTRFFFKDVAANSHKKVEHFLSQNKDLSCYLISGSESDVREYFNRTGLCEVAKNVSELDMPPVVKKANKKSIKVLQFNEHCCGVVDAWKPAEVNLSEGGVYVIVNHYDYCAGETTNNEFFAPKVLKKHLALLDKKPTIIGLRGKEVDKISKLENWVNFETYFKQYVESFFAYVEIETKIAAYNSANINQYWPSHFAAYDHKSFAKDSPFGQLVKECNSLREFACNKEALILSKLRAALWREPWLQFPTLDEKPLTKSLCDKIRNVLEVYPLLPHLRSVLYPIDKVVDYVNLVDKGTNP